MRGTLGDLPGKLLARRRFAREGELTAKLDHPGICAVYDTGVEQGLPYIAMRYVEGETLSRRINASREAQTSGCVPLEEIRSQNARSTDTSPTPSSSRGQPAVFKVLALIDEDANEAALFGQR